MRLDLKANSVKAHMDDILERADKGLLNQDAFFLLAYCETLSGDLKTALTCNKVLTAQLAKRWANDGQGNKKKRAKKG